MPQLLKNFKLNKLKQEKLLEIERKNQSKVKEDHQEKEDNPDKEDKLENHKANKPQKLKENQNKLNRVKLMLLKEKPEEEDQEKVNNDLKNKFHYFNIFF